MLYKVFFKSSPKLSSYYRCSVLSVAALVLVSAMNIGTNNDISSGAAPLQEFASLTSCIDNAALANEIEITGVAMKKAAMQTLGRNISPKVERTEAEHYCALNLV